MPVVRLSANVVERVSCPINKSKHDLFDSGCKGLTLEVRASGGKTWYLRFRDARGRQRQLRIADARDLDLRQARSRAEDMRGRIALGKEPDLERQVLRSIPTLSSFFHDRYLPYIKGYKRSWANEIGYFRRHVAPAIGSKHLDEISKTDVIAIHHGMRAAGYAPATANRVLCMVRHIFNKALDWEVAGIEKNPSARAAMFEENNLVERFLTPEEVHRLYQVLLASRNPQLRFIVPLLILSGARKREVLDARWIDIDLSRRQWRVPLAKSGRARHIPISDGLLAVLEGIPQPVGSEFVVPDPKTGKPYISLQYFWNIARREAGLSDVRMHDLRHSFASFLINAGRSIYEVQKILGHSQIRTTQRYAHLSQHTLLEAANVATTAIGCSFSIIQPEREAPQAKEYE